MNIGNDRVQSPVSNTPTPQQETRVPTIAWTATVPGGHLRDQRDNEQEADLAGDGRDVVYVQTAREGTTEHRRGEQAVHRECGKDSGSETRRRALSAQSRRRTAPSRARSSGRTSPSARPGGTCLICWVGTFASARHWLPGWSRSRADRGPGAVRPDIRMGSGARTKHRIWTEHADQTLTWSAAPTGRRVDRSKREPTRPSRAELSSLTGKLP
jgi:hypothetical protein